jgi:hypothetical protein
LRPSELSCNDYYRLTEYYEKLKWYEIVAFDYC